MAKESTIELYNDIRREYQKLTNITEFGVQKFTEAWIYNKLSKMFYKSPKTIENIVFYRTKE
jgi:hypothetical protein